ncbi:uncharacterized protein [Apostichopus japonicus]|uniref:uncharacterized protein n=1 Tax=Stichopus japonicus TaxID=307972 RepID=UPI003AB58A5A
MTRDKSQWPLGENSRHFIQLQKHMMHRLLMVVILSDREDVSPHLEGLVNCNVAIPAAWHSTVPFSPSLKSKAFLVKKMMDGFFEPQDMSKGNNSSVVKLFPLQMEAIRLYGGSVLKIYADVTKAINSKCSRARRLMKKLK